MKNIHYHKAGFLVTLLSTFGMRALAEDDGSREQLALALGMSKEVLNTFAKPLLGMAGDSILKLSEDARSAIDHELNSHLEGAIKTAYKDALYDIEQEIVKELDLKEDRSQLWRRLLLNEASEKREAYEQMMLDFFIPLRAALSDETSIKDMLDKHQQLQPDDYITQVIRNNLPAYAGADRELFVADIATRFRKHYPHHFLQQLKKDNKAKTVYFTITLEALLRGGIEQKAMLQMVLAELQGEIPAGLAAIKALIAERTTAIDAVLAKINQQIAAKAEPDLIDTDRHSKRTRPGNEGNLFNYKYRYTTFTGRNSQMSALQSFLEDKETYSWWMITGPGGMGKSRLALETIKVAIQKGWNAGFLDVKEDFDWAHWNPCYDTLMVIDYALAHTDATAALLEKVGARAERYRKKVRLLLLERSVTPEWKNVQTKPSIRDYTYKHPDANILELQPPDSLWLIVADVIMQSTLCADEKYALLQRETDIMNDLWQIDPQRRPLFAFFAAKAMVYSEGKSIRGWNVDRLLEFHLTRLETEYWAKSDVYRNNALAFKKLLLITTLCRQIPADQMQQLEKELQLPADSKSVYALLTDDKANENNARGYYTGLQPDILAGYFIISTLNALAEGRFAGMGTEDADNLLQKAWGLGSSGCAITIFLVWDDFVAGKEIVLAYDILKCLEDNIHTQSNTPRAKIQLAYLAILLSGIGDVYYAKKDFNSSKDLLDRAISMLSEFAESYNGRGIANSEVLYNSETRLEYPEPMRPIVAQTYYNRGILKNNPSDREGAIADYNEAIRLQPNFAQAYNNRGNVKNNLGDREGAIADYNEAIRLQPNFAQAYNNRGNVKSNIDDREGAIADYNEAIRLQPDDAQTLFNRGVMKNDLGDREGAIADYTEAIRLQPDDAKAFYSRGVVKDDLDDREGAIADYTEAIRLQPDDAQAYHDRGIVKDDLGDREGALADFNEAIRLQPDDAQAYNNRGVVRSEFGDKEGAISDFSEALRLQPNFAQGYYNRGVVNHDLGDMELAISDYTEAIRLQSDDIQSYYNRAHAKTSIGDREGAILDFSMIISLQPDDARAFHTRGVLKYDLGDKVGAISDFSETIRVQPDDAQAFYSRGVIKDELGDKEGAISDYTETIRLQPSYPKASYNRGVARLSKEDYVEAVKDFDATIMLSADDAHAYFHRGICHSQLGNTSAACADFKQALDLGYEEAREFYEQCPGH